MKIAIITDQHFGVRGDKSHFLDNQQKFYENVFFPKIDAEKINIVLDLGDTFDRRKYINFLTLKRADEMWFKPLEDRGLICHSIVGNHTSYYKNTNSVNYSMLVEKYGNFHTYENEPVELDFDGCKIMLSPWICAENQEVTMKAFTDTKAQILMGHFEISGYEMLKGQLCEHGLDKKVFNKFDSVYSGHFHHPSSHGNITYLGAPYEMTWSDYEGKRGFHIFDTDTRSMEFVPNPYRMFHKIVYEDSDLTINDIANLDLENLSDGYVKIIVKNKTNPYLFDMFIDKVEQAGAADIRVVEDHLDLDAIDDKELLDEAQGTMEILSQYLESLELSVDKKEVDKCLRGLYNEALSL